MLRVYSGSETDYEECSDHFPRFILESDGDTPLTNISPFLIQKVISINITPTNLKIGLYWWR